MIDPHSEDLDLLVARKLIERKQTTPYSKLVVLNKWAHPEQNSCEPKQKILLQLSYPPLYHKERIPPRILILLLLIRKLEACWKQTSVLRSKQGLKQNQIKGINQVESRVSIKSSRRYLQYKVSPRKNPRIHLSYLVLYYQFGAKQLRQTAKALGKQESQKSCSQYQNETSCE